MVTPPMLRERQSTPCHPPHLPAALHAHVVGSAWAAAVGKLRCSRGCCGGVERRSPSGHIQVSCLLRESGKLSQSTSSWGAPDRPLVWRCCSTTLSGRPGPQPRVPPDQAPPPLPLHPHFPRTADLEPDLIHQIRTKDDQCPVEETRAIARRAYLTYERDEPDRWVQLWR